MPADPRPFIPKGESEPAVRPDGVSADTPLWPDRIILAVMVLAVLLLTAAIGYHVGYLDGAAVHEDNGRTRAAVCQVLDQQGADASTGREAWPCQDLPHG